MRLHRFRYSPYAWKVQAALELSGLQVAPVEVPYLDRSALLRLSPKATTIPVLELSDGRILHDSRACLATLVSEGPLAALVPAGTEAAVWAYSDWCDSMLEMPLFQWCTPALRRHFFTTPTEKLMYTLIKERKYGEGAVESWERDGARLKAHAIRLLEPTLQSLIKHPFVLGQAPTLADAALFGQLAMVEVSYPGEAGKLGPGLSEWVERMHDRGVSRP